MPLKLLTTNNQIQKHIRLQNQCRISYKAIMYSPKRKMKTIPFTIASRQIKYVGANATKKVKSYWIKTPKVLCKSSKKM